MERVTRTLFPNYFNGSEIVIAGKLAHRTVERLHVEVTASNSKKFVVLKADVPVEPPEAGNDVAGSARPEGGGAGDPNHVQRLWSYLSTKELLSAWLHSSDERDKERLRQKAQALAVASRFLTPVTSMHLKRSGLQTDKPEDAQSMSAATGPEPVMQSLRGASPQPGNPPGGAAVGSRRARSALRGPRQLGRPPGPPVSHSVHTWAVRLALPCHSLYESDARLPASLHRPW